MSVAPHVEVVARIGAEVAAPAADAVDRAGALPGRGRRGAEEGAHDERVRAEGFLGGLGVGMIDLAAMCEALGQHCSSAAMVFAMHQIQVACLVRHGLHQPALRAYVEELCEKQHVIASVTSEVGVGGEMRRSVCAVSRKGDRFDLVKDATTISYGAQADDLLVTARRAPTPPTRTSRSSSCESATRRSSRRARGTRWACAARAARRFKMTSTGDADQIMTEPFADIAAQTMVPFSHVLWANCWLGIATGAVRRARAFVRQQARAKPGTVPPTALRLAEAQSMLQALRANVHDVAAECEELMATPSGKEALSHDWLRAEDEQREGRRLEQVVQIVHAALSICGIMGYKNDSGASVGRFLRDAHSAALMVGNDRILASNASMLLVLKDD